MRSSDGYSGSSDGYSGSSDGYSGSSEGNLETGEDPDTVGSRESGGAVPPDAWWIQAGFSTLEEGLAHQEALNDGMWGSPRSTPPAADPEDWLPGEVIAGAPARVPRDPTRQVNIRLGGRDHERLTALADDYGVATAVMARMLVRRGLLAVFKARAKDGAG
jgi:hypothetical protein